MGWGTDEHEGYANERRADGSWSDGITRGGDPEPVACRAVCSCGWRSEREHAMPPQPAGMPTDSQGIPRGPVFDAWIDALEAAERACQDDWNAEHFEPLLGYEPHTQLVEGRDGGGRRHFLDGRPVHAGAGLELLLRDDVWVGGRYEWSFTPGARPEFTLALGGPREAERQEVTPAVSFLLPSTAVLRWPARMRDDA